MATFQLLKPKVHSGSTTQITVYRKW